MEMHLQTILDLGIGSGEGEKVHPLLEMSTTIGTFDHPFLSGNGQVGSRRTTDVAWQDVLDRFDELSIPVWWFEATRNGIGVPTVKALSPVLRDWQPRFGPGRLYDLPVTLGLKSAPLAERDLNPVRFVC